VLTLPSHSPSVVQDHRQTSANHRPTSAPNSTSNAPRGCTCCGTAGGTPNESHDPTSPQTPPSASRTASESLSNWGRCPNKSPVAGLSDTQPIPASTILSARPPRSHSFPLTRTTTTMHRWPPSGCPKASISVSQAGHDPIPLPPTRPTPSAFFPPRAYSPSLTFAFVSTDISRV